ncbi:TPA: DMT family transporter [Serratia marcescens]|uniref:DMT family transporter n=1 Tax=Serratia marcescens TaxID=615 RepID=UPI00301E58F3
MRQLTRYMATAGLFLAVSLTWGTTWMAMKLALVSFPPLFATGLRFLIAAPMLVALTLRANKPLLFPRGKRKFQVLLAVFYFSIPFTLMIYGEETVSSGMAALLFSVMPVAVVITSWMFLGHTITRIQAMGVIIVMVALGMIILTESGTTEIESGKGVVAILMAVSLHAVVYVLCRKHCAGISVLTYNALPCLGAAVLLLGCSFFDEHIHALTITATAIYAVVYLGGVAGVLGIMAYFQLQKRVFPFYASLVYFVFPLIAITLEDYLTHHKIAVISEVMAVVFLFGIAFVIYPLWPSSLKRE